MKVAIRLFNVIIMALSLAATFFLFYPPTLSFNSNIALDVQEFSKFVPETTYSAGINIPELLGTNEIHVGIKFSLDFNGINEIKDGNRDKINQHIIIDNVNDMIDLLHEPVDLITDFTIRSVIKKTIIEEVTQQVEDAKNGSGSGSSAQDIMDEVGMDDEYFTNFSNALYDSANENNATIDSVSDVLYEQIDEALERAEGSGLVDKPEFSQEKREAIKTNLLGIFNELKLVKDDGTLVRISEISYLYLSAHLKTELQTKVSDPTTLEQGATESVPAYADRLLSTYVLIMMPDMFYQIVGYTSLGLFIGLFVFTGIWAILFLITLIKTFTKKPWTIFGPWFWILGLLQIVFGIGLTVTFKFILPSYLNVAQFGLPLKSVILVPRTYALIPSMIFAGLIIIAIVYAIIRSAAKKEVKGQ